MTGRSQYRSRWDGLSVAVSVLCLVHCVALPLLASILPLIKVAGLEDVRIELATLALTAFIGGWAIWSGFRHHRQFRIVLVFLLGLIMMTIANVVHSRGMEMTLKAAGAMLIIWAHLRNLSESRRFCCGAFPKQSNLPFV